MKKWRTLFDYTMYRSGGHSSTIPETIMVWQTVLFTLRYVTMVLEKDSFFYIHVYNLFQCCLVEVEFVEV